MEQQLPAVLQLALFVASLAIVVSVLVLVSALFRFRGQLERLVGAVEELKAEMKPLAHETRAVVRQLHDLTGRAQAQWMEVEGIVGTARHWSERANHLVDQIGAVVEPPVFAATHGIRRLWSGLDVFLRVLLDRNQPPQRKGRES